jgi:GntR family transcriptional regulator
VSVIKGESPTPKYRQLATLIRQRIDHGEFTPGDRIPSEAQLGDAYRLSRITIRQALANLEQEGLLERVPGKGTFVRRSGSHVERVTRLTGFGENVAALGLRPSYRTLKAEPMHVSHVIADRLRTQSAKAFVVERVLLADDEPIAEHTSYLPLWIVNAAPPEVFSIAALDRNSLYSAITQSGARMYRADEVVEPGLATRDEAQRLETHEDALVLRVARTVVDVDGAPLEYVLMTYLADAYTYRTTLYASASPA